MTVLKYINPRKRLQQLEAEWIQLNQWDQDHIPWGPQPDVPFSDLSGGDHERDLGSHGRN